MRPHNASGMLSGTPVQRNAARHHIQRLTNGTGTGRTGKPGCESVIIPALWLTEAASAG